MTVEELIAALVTMPPTARVTPEVTTREIEELSARSDDDSIVEAQIDDISYLHGEVRIRFSAA